MTWEQLKMARGYLMPIWNDAEDEDFEKEEAIVI